jgi:hypothetical protein
MIAANHPTRPIPDSPRSSEREPFVGWRRDQLPKPTSSRDALVMLEHPAERFDADNLLALGERRIIAGPFPRERFVTD